MRFIVFAALLVFSCRAAADPIAVEIARLESAAAALDPTKLNPQLEGLVKAARERVAAAKAANDPQLRLLQLRDAWIVTETLVWFADHAAESADLDRFIASWEREKKHFAENRTRTHADLLRSALSQQARNRAAKLSAASLPYARASAPFGGVYYLGEATANRRFADFLDSISAEQRPDPRPSHAALAAAADSVENAMLELFAADPTNRAAIPVSAKLKETRELLDAGLDDGAALLLLETRMELSRRTGAPAPGAIAATEDLHEVLLRSKP